MQTVVTVEEREAILALARKMRVSAAEFIYEAVRDYMTQAAIKLHAEGGDARELPPSPQNPREQEP